MKSAEKYVGIHNDRNGGMTEMGKIIRNAWIFGMIPERESCEGWPATGIKKLWRRVDAEWEQYDYMVGNLPDDLRQRFSRIHSEAVERARESGWEEGSELARVA
ncbi:hypothetical protein BOW53_12410 [Solemya pervernicosa gill symbiont]|uniref:Uncharacterized protein n=2 Tax=Gammaproteobacteria incertae sedis TaxID=118884 RepID=A0A1T2L2D6_9GAMM|nr:hypothetical protein [Candidatus Reidiella endopervernicosa]OOZ39255.1 hypothetical protein BOW53_12410 [Solemya pervernicosa gill symbiont]QKQ25613.1 hypothetical protein HUE57_04355 [Candidatus Reidiella endopervernicosa]